MAAGALHALEHHRDRLAQDHRRARALAGAMADLPGIELDLDAVETNIIRFRSTAVSAVDLARRSREGGVVFLAFNDRDLRAVTHLDVGTSDVTEPLARLGKVFT